jgi:CDP-diacylglycerol---glycerol-3-phosphate 3-phosphatidyltransferase
MSETTAKSDAGTAILNVPNTLSLVRLVLSFVVFVLIGYHYFLAANLIFIFAVATDWVDGYWARKYGQVTKFGRVLDPFVDKIIICGTFIYLAANGDSRVSAGAATIVVGRELLVTALRSMIEGKGGDFSAKQLGKWKMVAQCAAAVASMLLLWLGKDHPASTGWLAGTTIGLVWFAVAITLVSGAEYVKLAWREMIGR